MVKLPDSVQERERRAEKLLREMGFSAGRVSAAGHEGEIAALSVSSEHFERLLGEEGARLSSRLRALGFRFVALDLDAAVEDAALGGGAQ